MRNKFFNKEMTLMSVAFCLFIFSGTVRAQEDIEYIEGTDSDTEINVNAPISTDPRPFKRRALPKKPVQEEITSPSQMRQMLGAPHEMSDVPAAPSMPSGFSVSNPPQEVPQSATQAAAPAFQRARPRRGGAGGVTRPEQKQAKSPLAQKKLKEAQAKRTQEKLKNPTPKEKFVQEGLKMFDEQTAKEVMNVQPSAKELEKISPESRQKLLDSIDVNQTKHDEKTEEKEDNSKGKNNNMFRNIKANPYG